MSTLQLIAPRIHMSTITGGVYETSKYEVEPDTKYTTTTTVKPYARWGKDNNYPQRLIDAVKSDPIAALIEKKASLHYGRGMYFYRKDVDERGNEKITVVPDRELPQEMKDFMRENDFKKFMQGVITDYEWWHSFGVQYVTDGTGKVLQVKWQRMKDIRPEKRDLNTGEVKNYYLSGYWPTPLETQYAVVPAFDPKATGSGLYVHSAISIDKDYFSDPAWHGVTKWLYVASKIPRWILANIDNSMNLKYHVQIPFKYFQDRNPLERYPTDAEWKAAIQADIESTFKRMDEYLAGEQNVHKAFYSFISLMEDGKPAPGWEITVLDNKIQDEAWLKAYGTATIAMISGIGLSPSIAGSILPNGLGSGSGSDLREQFNYYIQVMTTMPREVTLEPWELIKYRNGWPEDIHLGFRDVVFQSLDQNKSGFAVSNEQSPTSDSQQTKQS